MSGTLKLGRVFGIDVKIHFSWVFIFALVAWSLATSYLPDSYPRWTSRTYWVVGVISSALLFVSVLIHEFSHSLVAISRGHPVRSITLFFLGGVSEIQEESHNAGEEFWIAVVGPLTSFALALIFWLLFQVLSPGAAQLRAITQYLAVVNLTLGVFNLMPAFPLDGGRVLKAVVWKATRSEERATTVASFTGSMLGFALIGAGVFFASRNNFITGIWLIFIGWFIQSSASSVRRQRGVERALSGKLVRDAMRKDFPTVAPGITVESLVSDYINKDFERAYLITLGDSLHGLVSLSDVRKVPPELRGKRYVTEIMTRASDVKTVRAEDPLEAALEALVTTGYSQLVVADGGKPVGLVTRGDVLRVLEIAQLFPSARVTARKSR